MIIVADTNILFSACLTPDSRIFEILFNASNQVQIVSSHYAIEELERHKAKLIRLSRHTAQETETLLIAILKQVEFFDEGIVEEKHWLEADRLTTGVDSKDISFVALTLQTGALLWPGDKKLTNHLIAMGFIHLTTTALLYERLGI
jgi:predicted nucleic acid-binding protein